MSVPLPFNTFRLDIASSGGGGVTIVEVDEHLGEGEGLTQIFNDVILIGGTELINLGSANAAVLAFAGPTEKEAVLDSFTLLAQLVKDDFMGAMLEGVNAGELVQLDGLRRPVGYYPGLVSIQELILGTPETVPPDAEALRGPEEYQDVTASIAGGNLTINIANGVRWNFDFSANLTLRFTILPALLIGRGLDVRVKVENTHATLARTLSFTSGGGFADVALLGGLAAPFSIPALTEAILHITLNEVGVLLIESHEAGSGAGLVDGDMGDITVSGSGTALTIDNDVVTPAKMSNASAQFRILARSSVGAGDWEELTSSTDVFAMLGAANDAAILAAIGAKVAGADETANVAAASETAAGKVELATVAETNTGNDAARPPSADTLAGSYAGTKSIPFCVFGSGTSWATGNGVIGHSISSDLNGMNLVEVRVQAHTAGTTGTGDIQIRRRRSTTDADMLSTPVTLNSAAVAAADGVINTSNDDVLTDDVLYIDVDAVHTTPALGLTGSLIFRLP